MEARKKTPPLGGILKKRGKLLLLLAGALLGLILLLVGGMSGDKAEEGEAPRQMTLAELETYRAELEEEIEKICSSVAGVSSVEAIVTLEGGLGFVYQTDENGEIATTGSGSSQQAICKTVTPPVIAGVGIVCRGGSEPTVQKELTDLLSTALGISANRVCVVGK